ncbi:MAG: amino acid decarboxylase [Ruminococcaceae bacterium]|nr:amino acid decarboxylase [Oscillospiraceae bacterium]
MNTPIFDFVSSYAKSGKTRLHMPGHKGIGALGCEEYDITEIVGADSLYEASGIIKESEANASLLFGCDTYYSTEGSSQCIRAMLHLAMLHAKSNGKRQLVLAGRNAHKAFLSAAALIGFDIEWLYGNGAYLSCEITVSEIEEKIAIYSPAAVYLTSPDYLGKCADIAAISAVCKKLGVMLLVDNAHGAYLKFLAKSRHPIDLGADICCDSAHKTLPVLTGGAYLHTKEGFSAAEVKNALALFGSTSPSYLILQSLDLCNKYIADGFAKKLDDFVKKVALLKKSLVKCGYTLIDEEPLKITIAAKEYGYFGYEIAEYLEKCGLVCEFFDRDYTVLMLTKEIGNTAHIEKTLKSLPKKAKICAPPPKAVACERAIPIREAAFLPSETVLTKDSLGRVLAVATVGCPPAVPIVICGERINEEAIECFKYYGVDTCTVVK